MISRTAIIHWLSYLHQKAGILPFASLLITTGLIGAIGWQKGCLPSYRYPTGEGWDVASMVAFFLFFVWGYATYAWIALTVILLVAAPRALRRNTISIALCLLGIGAYVALLRLGNVSQWILD